jgi:uncharacterized protein YbaA (DUF1428 family)
MAHYVDGFVVPVPLRNLDAYRRMSEQAGKVWMDHGALQYWECIGDDVKPGKVTSFPQSVQLQEGEVVVFSWILYKLARAPRQRQRQGDGRSANEEHDGSQEHAL